MTQEQESYEKPDDLKKWDDRHPGQENPGQEKAVVVLDNSPAALIAIAVGQGADLEKLERLLALQIKWEENEAKKAYVKAMADFKTAPPAIDKDKTVSYGVGDKKTTYTHASLANVTRKINDGLSKHGLSAGWSTKQESGNITVTCKITHEMGHSESTSLTAAPDISGSKNAIQAVGSTISYLERYTILALTGLATADMDNDGGDSEPEFITEKQVSEITDMMNDIGLKESSLTNLFKCDFIEKIPANKYQEAMTALKDAKKRKEAKAKA